MNKKSIIVFCLIALIILLGLIIFWFYETKINIPPNLPYSKGGTGLKSPPDLGGARGGISSDHNSELPTESNSPLARTIPNSFLLSVPFTPQAPTANWDELHNEACEEAVAIMAYEYFSENTSTTLDPKQVEARIGLLTDWQQQNLGYNLSITTEETANMIESVYKLKTKIINNFTETDIKQAISEDKLVILPANGRLLNNPYFKSPGPIYHMLIITGYDEQGFITNDPGTKRGYNYRYSFSTLYKASASWIHKIQTTNTDIKNIIIVSK